MWNCFSHNHSRLCFPLSRFPASRFPHRLTPLITGVLPVSPVLLYMGPVPGLCFVSFSFLFQCVPFCSSYVTPFQLLGALCGLYLRIHYCIPCLSIFTRLLISSEHRASGAQTRLLSGSTVFSLLFSYVSACYNTLLSPIFPQVVIPVL